MHLIHKYNVEIAACQILKVSDDNAVNGNEDEDILVRKNNKWMNILHNHHSAEGFCCNKIYSRNVLSDLNFDQSLSMCEDQLFAFEAVAKVEDIAVSTKQLYFYRRNNTESVTHRLDETLFEQRLLAAKKIMNIIQNCGDEKTIQDYKTFLLFDAYYQYCRYLVGYRPAKWKDKYKTQREKAIACISDKTILNRTGRLLVKSNTGFIAYSWLWARARNIKIKIEGLRPLM